MNKKYDDLTFQHVRNNAEKNQYKEKKKTISKTKAMVMGTLYALPLVLLFGFIYRFLLIDRAHLIETSGFSFYILFLVIIITSVIIHECLHGLGWLLFGRNGWNSIRFNIHAMMPSCACNMPLSREKYLFGVLLPFVVLGCCSVVFMFVYPGTVSVLAMIVNIIISGADIMIAVNVANEKNALIIDHPTEAGYIALTKR